MAFRSASHLARCARSVVTSDLRLTSSPPTSPVHCVGARPQDAPVRCGPCGSPDLGGSLLPRVPSPLLPPVELMFCFG